MADINENQKKRAKQALGELRDNFTSDEMMNKLANGIDLKLMKVNCQFDKAVKNLKNVSDLNEATNNAANEMEQIFKECVKPFYNHDIAGHIYAFDPIK